MQAPDPNWGGHSPSPDPTSSLFSIFIPPLLTWLRRHCHHHHHHRFYRSHQPTITITVITTRGVDPGGWGLVTLKICRRGQSMFWTPRNETFHSKLLSDNSTSFTSSRTKSCVKMEGKTNYFSRRLRQFDGLTWLTLTPIFYDRSTPLITTAVSYSGFALSGDIWIDPSRIRVRYSCKMNLKQKYNVLRITRTSIMRCLCHYGSAPTGWGIKH